MRVVVTGATGNIGTAVLRRLAQDGHTLVGLARRVPSSAGVEWRSVDLTSVGPAELTAAFADADAVVHLAWGFQPSHDLAYLRELGVGGTRRVGEAVVHAGVPHLVHLSSLGAYAPKADDAPVDESWPTTGVPTSRYSRHKAAAEQVLDDLQGRAPDLVVTRLRPGVVGQRAAGSALLRYGVPGLVPRAALGWLPVLPLDRGLTIPLVHADDVADAVARALDRRAGGAFNLAAGPPVTAADIADALGARLVHLPSEVLRPPGPAPSSAGRRPTTGARCCRRSSTACVTAPRPRPRPCDPARSRPRSATPSSRVSSAGADVPDPRPTHRPRSTHVDDDRHSIPRSELTDGAVRRVGRSAVGLSGGEPFAVSGRCRHQLADLSTGSVDADGCLVCPWHGARYDVHEGRMVRGPQGFLGYHGRTARYAALVVSYARLLPLRRHGTTQRGDRIEVDGS